MQIIQVTNPSQIKTITELAEEIIPEYYSSFLPMEHVRFFINTYQTETAINKQLKNGFEYYLINESDTSIGYLGLERKKDTLVLSKIYVLNPYRGKGIGTQLLDLTHKRAALSNASTIELLVVKQNEKAIRFYKKNGFTTSEIISHKYESGFVVEEYLMRKHLGK